jgi:glycosyltransferase involved in cell wall biosynthesis
MMPSSVNEPARLLSQAVTVSLVIPCFNEEAALPLLAKRIDAAAAQWPANYEIILVDDGSRDATWKHITACHARDPHWKGIRLARNFGHQIALWTGLQHATGEVIAVLDADLQDPPEILSKFFAKWEEGFDVIYAVRQERKESRYKRMAYYLYYRLLAYLSEIEIPLDSGDFCVLDRQVLRAILTSREQVPFIRGLRAWVGFRQTALPYERDKRVAGEVKYTFRKLVQLGLNGIFSFSTRPLRLATYFGFIVSVTAFLGVLLTVVQRLLGEQLARVGLQLPPGMATTVISILFLGGVQLLCLGILGEYIGRIYENVKGRPLAVLRDQVGLAANSEHDSRSAS